MVVKKMRKEESVTRLSREMVRDYMKAKSNVRRYTPDLGSKRVRWNQEYQRRQDGRDEADAGFGDKGREDQIILESEDAQSRLEFDGQPKFRSAMNTPYQAREK